MFPTSSLHTDFARQTQVDRLADVRIPRRSRGTARARLSALLAAAARPFRRSVPVVVAVEPERPAVV